MSIDRDQSLTRVVVAGLLKLRPTARDALGRAMAVYRDACRRQGATGEEAELAGARFAAAVIAELERAPGGKLQ